MKYLLKIFCIVIASYLLYDSYDTIRLAYIIFRDNPGVAIGGVLSIAFVLYTLTEIFIGLFLIGFAVIGEKLVVNINTFKKVLIVLTLVFAITSAWNQIEERQSDWYIIKGTIFAVVASTAIYFATKKTLFKQQL